MATKAQALPRENTNRRAVYDYLFKHPGKTSTEVSEGLNLSHSEVSGPLSQLYAEGKLERQKVPNSFGKHAYFIPDRERPVTTKVVTKFLPAEPVGDRRYNEMRSEYNALEAVRDRLEVEVVELRQWKADAIAKHPDLVPVDPLLLRARELAAKTLRDGGLDQFADNTADGANDDSFLVQALLKVLQEAQQ